MKKLDLSAVSTTVGLPVKGGTINHIQSAYQEGIAEGVKALIGLGYDPNVTYILNGLVNSSTHPQYNLSAGSVFRNGEVYIVDAVNINVGGNTAVMSIQTSFQTGTDADSVQFTDGVARNIHVIRKGVVAAGLAGSTDLGNYVDAVRINTNQPNVNITAGNAGISIGGAFPNFSVSNLYPPPVNPILYYRKVFLGDLNTDPGDGYTTRLAGSTSGLTAYQHNFPTPFTGKNILPVLQIGNQGHDDWGGFNDNFMCTVHLGKFDTDKMYFAIGTTASGNTQSLDLFYHIIQIP